jgi:hypothetical protein
MKESQLELFCSVCDKRVTLREEFCVDENLKAVHTDCFAERILQDSRSSSGTPV